MAKPLTQWDVVVPGHDAMSVYAADAQYLDGGWLVFGARLDQDDAEIVALVSPSGVMVINASARRG